ncbi:hypothetical protein EWM64_g830, partial [Hericium alpestre]
HAENRELASQLAAQTQARLNVSEKLDTAQTGLRVAEAEIGVDKTPQALVEDVCMDLPSESPSTGEWVRRSAVMRAGRKRARHKKVPRAGTDEGAAASSRKPGRRQQAVRSRPPRRSHAQLKRPQPHTDRPQPDGISHFIPLECPAATSPDKHRRSVFRGLFHAVENVLPPERNARTLPLGVGSTIHPSVDSVIKNDRPADTYFATGGSQQVRCTVRPRGARVHRADVVCRSQRAAAGPCLAR